MDISDDFLCLFTAQIDTQNETNTIEIPEREVTISDLDDSENYRIAIFPTAPQNKPEQSTAASETEQGPPVSVGNHYKVEIEDIGEQGDGLARIGPGYIIFVPDTEIGDRVTVEITDANENVGFAEVVDKEPIA